MKHETYGMHVEDSADVGYYLAGDRGLLPTVGRGGMTVEIGPLAHSTVHAASMLKTMLLIQRALVHARAHTRTRTHTHTHTSIQCLCIYIYIYIYV